MSQNIFDQIKGKLIVSCQALEHEPLFGSQMMAMMANAAKAGGAAAIRANSVVDIAAIKAATQLPIIGLIKKDYDDCEVYITPTIDEVLKLMAVGVDLLALDATKRERPYESKLEDLIGVMKAGKQKIMADISTLEEALYAEALGVDCVSTTLSGYTFYSPQHDGPDFELVEQAANKLKIPVIAEGKIYSPEQAARMLDLGAHAVVVGSAITRPQLITERYAKALGRKKA